MKLTKEFRFEASHQISNHPGKCVRLHGHSWVLRVTVEGRIDPTTGMILDFYEIKNVIQPIVDRLDHQHLGRGSVFVTNKSDYGNWLLPATVVGLPDLPTSENLLVWIAQQLPLEFPWRTLELNETCTSAAILEKEEFLRVSYIRTIDFPKKGDTYGETKARQDGKEDA